MASPRWFCISSVAASPRAPIPAPAVAITSGCLDHVGLLDDGFSRRLDAGQLQPGVERVGVVGVEPVFVRDDRGDQRAQGGVVVHVERIVDADLGQFGDVLGIRSGVVFDRRRPAVHDFADGVDLRSILRAALVLIGDQHASDGTDAPFRRVENDEAGIAGLIGRLA